MSDLSGSEPRNVTTVDGPVTEVRLTFTAAADPVAEEFSVSDASGAEVPIASIENDGERVVVVTPETPLTAGRNRVVWAIRSGDSHTMTGSISFTVASASSRRVRCRTDADGPRDDRRHARPTIRAPSPRGVADHLATAARWLVYAALFLCVGGLAYLARVHRGTEAEGRALVFHVRRAAVVVLLASTIEWLAQLVAARGDDVWAVFSPGAWADLADTGLGKGTALRLLGAGLVLVFLRIDHTRKGEHRFSASDLELDASDLPPTPAAGGPVGVTERRDLALSRLRLEASPLAFVGAAALVVSEAFIGHTSTVGPRPVVLVSDAAHLLAGAAWVAGGLMLALTLRRRHRQGRPLDARLLASRFSAMATGALLVVAISGATLTWAILRTPSAVGSTEFGRILLVKLALVAIAVGIGFHTRRAVVPTLSRGDDDAAHRFRRLLSAEVVVFAAILLFTALLVVADPT